MPPIPLNKSNMTSFEELGSCEELVQVLATRKQSCRTCKKQEFVDHLHFIVDEGCILNPVEGVPELVDICCGHCKSTQAVKVCAKCNKEFYCNKKCQKSHWSLHSKKCSPVESSSNVASGKVISAMSNGDVCNGGSSIHVPTPLAQPAKSRVVANTGEEKPIKGKGDLVRISGDEVDKVQQKSAEVVNGPKAVCKKIEKIDLKSDDKFEFLLTFGSNPSNFYIQRSSDSEKASFITECLNRECPKMKSWDGVKTLEVGQFCAGLYENDGNWYRAKLLQKIGDEFNISFIDFGNPDAVKASNLRPLPVELIDTPALAIHCKLHDIKPLKEGDWSEESVEKFGTQVESGKFTECQVYGCNKDGIYSVDLFQHNGPSIAEAMVKSKLASKISVPVPTEVEEVFSPKVVKPATPKITKQLTPKAVEPVPQSVVKPIAEVVDKVEIVEPPPVNLASSKQKMSLSSLRKLRKPEKVKMRSILDDLVVGNKAHPAIFTSIYDKDELKYCFMFNVELFCDISNSLNNKLEKNSTPVINVKVGTFVAVKSDDEWHRAYVLKVKEVGCYSCLLLDVGFVGTFEDVFPLPDEFHSEPSLFALATVIGESSQKAAANITECEEPTPVSIVILKKEDEVLARVKFEQADLECNMSLKSYADAIKEITESLEEKNPFDLMPVVTLNGGEQSALVVYQMPEEKFIFFVVPDADTMGRIMEEVPVQQRLGKPIESPKVGTYCLAKSYEDHEWYRAMIIKTNGGKCRVYFLDFGNEDNIENNRLLSIPPEISPEKEPAQAVKCVLKENVRNDKSYKMIAAAAEGTLLKMEVLEKQNNHYIVSI